MKSNTFLLIIILFLLGSTVLNAQHDVLFKTDGNEMMGQLVEMDSTDVKFILNNETAPYTIPKNEIIKIKFASGKTEFMESGQSSKTATKNSNSVLSKNHNQVAILPFIYFKDRVDASKSMSHKIQAKTYGFYRKQKTEYQFQDPKSTNALLSKAGVNNIGSYSMEEICDILNVEYIIQGSVSVEQTSQTSYSNTSKRRKFETESPKKSGLLDPSLPNSKEIGSAGNTTSSNYTTAVTLNIYNDKGENIFTQERSSYNSNADSYSTMLKNLVKKSPIYSK